ncbi:MAG: hypothetical protein HOV81_11820, partial [Kofleriaceae bacterium]|nr:hypothetical protein [Kofleriaceae bacterium]
MGNDLAAMRVQTRFATTEAVIESIGASLTRGSLRVPVQIKAKQPFDVVLETSSGDEAVRGPAEVIGHAGDATWIRFLSAADNQGDDARWILSDVKVVLQGDLRETSERKVATEQFEAITAVNSEVQAIDAIRAGNAEPVPLAPLMQVPVVIPRPPILPPKPPVQALKTKLDRRFDLSTGEAAPLKLAELTRAAGLAPKLQLPPLMDLSPKAGAAFVDLGLKADLAPEQAPSELAAGSGIVPRVVERPTTNSDDLAIPVEPVATAPTVAVSSTNLEQASTQPIGIVVAAKLAAAESVRVRPPTMPPIETRAETKTTPPPVADTPTAHARTQPLPLLHQLTVGPAPDAPAPEQRDAGDAKTPEPNLDASTPKLETASDARFEAKTTENAPLVAPKPEDPAVPLDGAPKAVITEEAEPMVMESESSTRPTEQQEPLRLEIKSDAMKPLAMPLGSTSVVVTMTAAPSETTTPTPIPRTPVAAITAGLDLDQTKPNEAPADERDAKRPHVTDQIARERGIRPITSPPRRAPLQPRPIMIACAGIAAACMIATISTIVWARGAVSEARAQSQAAASDTAGAPVAAGTPVVAAARVTPVTAAAAATTEPVAYGAPEAAVAEPLTASE